MKTCSGTILLIVWAAAAVAGAADEPADPHAACAAMGWVPREVLERPVPLRSGVGNAHEVVTTASKEAQAFYDQGLNYLHGYVWIEAARSFQQALRHDPDLAMAHLGLSRVYSGLDAPAEARRAWEHAGKLATRATEREQRRVALRGLQLDAIEDLGSAEKHAAYKKGLDAALAKTIDDVELWLLRGNAEEPTAAGRGQRGGVTSAAFYQEALRLSPGHGAAHHYLTHSYETIGQIPRALEHGEAYAGVAPAVPHAHHMWGHDLRRVGRIDDAIAAFRRTDELETAYYEAEGIPPGLDWHHVHNLDLLGTSYQHKGQMKRAEATLREAHELPALTEYLEFNQKALAGFLLARGRWTEALTEARALAGGKWAPTRVVGHAYAGHALLALGRQGEAGASLAAAERELATVPTLVGGIQISRRAAQPFVDMLRGEILLRSGKRDEGRTLLEDVARLLRELPGPDAWIQALFRLEAIARAAREAGDWDLAGYIAGQLLEHDPAYAGTHLAAAAVAQHGGDHAAAEKAWAAAERCWRDADADLPELEQLKNAARRRASTSAPAPASAP